MHVISSEKSSAFVVNACLQLLLSLCQKKEGLNKICASAGFGPCFDSTVKIVHDLSTSDNKVISGNSDIIEKFVSAIQFLLVVLSNEEKKLVLVNDSKLLKSMESIALNYAVPSVQYFATLYLGACIRISYALSLSVHQSESVSHNILSIINSSPSRRSKGQNEKASGITSFGDYGDKRHFNENLILASCFQILQIQFGQSSPTNQKEMIKSLQSAWKPMLQSLVVQKKSVLRNRNAGFAMDNMMVFASIACSNTETKELIIQNDSFISDLIDLVLANPFAEKMSVEDEVVRVERMFWRSAMAHALNALAFLTSCPTRDWSAVFSSIYEKSVSSRLNFVRQQESPSFEGILFNISNSCEASAASAALKILDNIKL